MKITQRQLRRIIREYGRSEHGAEARGMAASYDRGYSDGLSTPQSPPTTGRDPEYLRGYEKGAADAEDSRGEAKYIREAEGSTKKYDTDSALKGEQSKLPDGLQKGIIDKTVEDREEQEEEDREEKNESLRITNRQLRRVIRESLAQDASEEEIAVAVLPLTQAQDWTAAAKLLLSIFSYADLQAFLDDSELADELENAGVSYDDMRKIEDAAWPIENARMKAAIAADPDKGWLEFLGDAWTSQIEPDDMKDIKWKEYKNYIRLKPPRSISHGVGEIEITDYDLSFSGTPGPKADFVEFLERRTGGQLGRRKPYRKSPAPYYD